MRPIRSWLYYALAQLHMPLFYMQQLSVQILKNLEDKKKVQSEKNLRMKFAFIFCTERTFTQGCGSAQAPLFLTFEQSFMFFTTKENSSQGYFLQICLSWIPICIFKAAGSGSASRKLLDLDLQKMNADQQPWAGVYILLKKVLVRR